MAWACIAWVPKRFDVSSVQPLQSICVTMVGGPRWGAGLRWQDRHHCIWNGSA